MELRTFNIGAKSIKFEVTLNAGRLDEKLSGKTAEQRRALAEAVEERTITAHEMPLPELTTAFGKLPPVFCSILEVPSEWATGLSIFKIVVSRTKHGTRSIRMWAKKQLDTRTDYLHTVTTPMMQIDKPAEGESGSVQIDKKHVDLILKALHQAERYAAGERSQTLLNFDEAKAALNATAAQGQEQLGFANA